MSTVKLFFRDVYLKHLFQFTKYVKVKGEREAIVGGNIAVNGDLKTAGDITIGKNASINGNVQAANLMIYGKILGNVVCSGKATIADNGFVKGNISGTIIYEGANILEFNELQPHNSIELNIAEVKNESVADTDVIEKWF